MINQEAHIEPEVPMQDRDVVPENIQPIQREEDRNVSKHEGSVLKFEPGGSEVVIRWQELLVLVLGVSVLIAFGLPTALEPFEMLLPVIIHRNTQDHTPRRDHVERKP